MQRQDDGVAVGDFDELWLGAEVIADLRWPRQADILRVRIDRRLRNDAAFSVDDGGARAIERPAAVQKFVELIDGDRHADEADATGPVAYGLHRGEHRDAGNAAALNVANGERVANARAIA